MQTRKKSVSLAALGIAIPGTHPSRSSHRSPSSAAATSGSTTNNNSNNNNPEPPAKRLKRSHTLSSAPTAFSTPATPKRHRHASSVSDRQRPPQFFPSSNDTPPQSPRSTACNKGEIDLEGINDDVVVAVLETLQRTGNRPHLIKELATMLSHRLKVVERYEDPHVALLSDNLQNPKLTCCSSSNPVAIVSSRLSNYLRRPWTALAPCPLAKEQVNIHPRRVYYYLTTSSRQEIPEYSEHPSPTSVPVISPPASSTHEEDEEQIEQGPQRTRDQPSPSPEFELPDLDMNQVASLSGLTFADGTYQAAHEAVYSTPEEREFEHTVSVMQARKQSEQAEYQQQLQLQQQQQEQQKGQEEQLSATSSIQDSPSPPELSHSHSSSEEPLPSLTADSPTSLPDAPNAENNDPRDADNHSTITDHADSVAAAAFLFGQPHIVHSNGSRASDLTSSPIMQPISGAIKAQQQGPDLNMLYGSNEYYGAPGVEDMFAPSGGERGRAVSSFDAWGGSGDLKSPENVGLNELDDLLGGFCEG
ncbi:MAG: hypothetical protein M1831_002643 [Alyxoria varia]|nr:MAG: hypothetical protein M1831_002643 [Alyxoria varia]